LRSSPGRAGQVARALLGSALGVCSDSDEWAIKAKEIGGAVAREGDGKAMKVMEAIGSARVWRHRLPHRRLEAEKQLGRT